MCLIFEIRAPLEIALGQSSVHSALDARHWAADLGIWIWKRHGFTMGWSIWGGELCVFLSSAIGVGLPGDSNGYNTQL